MRADSRKAVTPALELVIGTRASTSSFAYLCTKDDVRNRCEQSISKREQSEFHEQCWLPVYNRSYGKHMGFKQR